MDWPYFTQHGSREGSRRLNGYRLLDKVIQGVIFEDGIDPEKAAKEETA